jgi:hypothetical protein
MSIARVASAAILLLANPGMGDNKQTSQVWNSNARKKARDTPEICSAEAHGPFPIPG